MDIGLCSGDADRISQLPEDIIHHILSFLPTTRDLVRVSALSKLWYRFFNSFPVSDFSLQWSPSLNAERTLQFVKFVQSSLRRQSLHHKCIPKFKLGIPRYSKYPHINSQLMDLIDSSVLLSGQFGIQELSLRVPLDFKYKLLEAIFTTNWLSLRVFSLEGVDISHQSIIENLIVACPLIEKFSLIKCFGVNQLRLLGLTKLKEVVFKNVWFRLEFRDEVHGVEIDALSLQSFSYYSGSCNRTAHIDLTSCKNLEIFDIDAQFIPDSIIEAINSKFPVLKLLTLSGHASGSQRIELSCPSLEELHLCRYYVKAITITTSCLEKLHLSTYCTETIIINAPRLKSFDCSFEKRIPLSLSLDQNSLKEVFLEVSLENIYSINGYNFLKSLIQNVGNFNQISQLTWYIDDFYWIHLIGSKISIPASLHIKHLKLRIDLCEDAIEEDSQALVDVLFRFCHPESLLVEGGFRDPELNNEFIKLYCKNLIYSCLATNGKCWQHDFKGLVNKIELIQRNGDIIVLPYNALLDSLPTLAPEDRIRFVFEW